MAKKEIGNSIVLENVVLAFAGNLYEPKVIVEGPPKYSVMAFMDPKSDAAKELKAAVDDLIKERWPGEDDEFYGSLRRPYVWGPKYNAARVRRGKKPVEELEVDGGQVMANPTSPQDSPPELIDRWGRPMNKKGEIYSGCVANVAVRLFTYYKSDINVGVSMWVTHVMFVRDGERKDGRASAKEAFGDLLSSDAPPPRDVAPDVPTFSKPSAPSMEVDFDDDITF